MGLDQKWPEPDFVQRTGYTEEIERVRRVWLLLGMSFLCGFYANHFILSRRPTELGNFRMGNHIWATR
jgi:hypothetical protein